MSVPESGHGLVVHGIGVQREDVVVFGLGVLGLGDIVRVSYVLRGSVGS